MKDYLDQLMGEGHRSKACARIIRDIQVLAAEGLRTPLVSVRSLGGRTWELRRSYQGVQYRVLFGCRESELWLLHAFEKKTDKTPLADLRLAQKRWEEIDRRE